MSPVGFFSRTPSRILRMVNICVVVDLFLWKPFWFFLRMLTRTYNEAICTKTEIKMERNHNLLLVEEPLKLFFLEMVWNSFIVFLLMLSSSSNIDLKMSFQFRKLHKELSLGHVKRAAPTHFCHSPITAKSKRTYRNGSYQFCSHAIRLITLLSKF